ncbi:MAG: GIY-YIG nuclease family protein [Candidatus Yonathbacteria bacterium]|nr:GIY-YIG nuclease family protein [Candidatus Yonathbacteria bacterium]
MNKITKKLPEAPGIYILRGTRHSILYIGKATSLRARVASYFRNDLMATRGPIIASMIGVVKTVDFIKTDSVLEALILEAHLIKKYKPPYNTKEKDNKSFNFVVITKEKFPRVMTMRSRNLETKHPSELKPKTSRLKAVFGPFPQGVVLHEALTMVRKIFSFRDTCKVGQGKPCFNAQIGLCPGVCVGRVSQNEYTKTIQHIKLFFEGKKPALIRLLEHEMRQSAQKLKFEEALRIKKTIFALKHIQDVALLKADHARETRPDLGNLNLRSDLSFARDPFRIEAYDIAHISGTNTVGVMIVVEDGEPKKSDYRKFKIKTSTNDDNASLREILSRRFEHTEWQMPKLIIVDGGKAQVNTAEKALTEWGIAIPVVGVVKDKHHRPKDIFYGKSLPRAGLGGIAHERSILLANSEAHRFAVAYHQKLRGEIK